jgi:hypothetical protein
MSLAPVGIRFWEEKGCCSVIDAVAKVYGNHY